MSQNPISIFISYAREDAEIKKVVLNDIYKQITLNLYPDYQESDYQGKLSNIIRICEDNRTGPGDWPTQINDFIDTSQIYLILLSSNFIKSDNCFNIEVNRMMGRYRMQLGVPIPIHLKPWFNKDFYIDPFKDVQSYPWSRTPVTTLTESEYDKFVIEISLEIIEIQEKYVINSEKFFISRKNNDENQIPEEFILMPEKREPLSVYLLARNSSELTKSLLIHLHPLCRQELISLDHTVMNVQEESTIINNINKSRLIILIEEDEWMKSSKYKKLKIFLKNRSQFVIRLHEDINNLNCRETQKKIDQSWLSERENVELIRESLRQDLISVESTRLIHNKCKDYFKRDIRLCDVFSIKYRSTRTCVKPYEYRSIRSLFRKEENLKLVIINSVTRKSGITTTWLKSKKRIKGREYIFF
jgi:hypothetical protein